MRQTKKDDKVEAIETTESTESTAIVSTLDFSGLPDFTADEYVDRKARIPKLTALRGEIDPNVFGLFVKLEDAAEVELSIPDGMEPVTYTYNNGDKADGYMFQKDFGMCVLPMSPLLAFPKNQGPGTPILPEAYDTQAHKGNPDFSAGRIYNVLLVVGGALLHERPLQLVVKGTASATFGKAWESDTIQVGKLYCAAKGKTYRPMNFEFNRMVIYYPVMARELSGKDQKSAALTFQMVASVRSLTDRLMLAQHELVASALVPLAPQQGEHPLMLAEMADDMPF